MRTVVLGERPVELEDLIARRRALGQDGHDEIWEGDYHVAPHAHSHHGMVERQVEVRLFGPARAAGLVTGGSFNLGEPTDFRVPDGGYHRTAPHTLYVPTAAIVVEVLSPSDETFAKFGFYAAHGVEEILVADPATRTVRCWHLVGGRYGESAASGLLGLPMAALQADIDWP